MQTIKLNPENIFFLFEACKTREEVTKLYIDIYLKGKFQYNNQTFITGDWDNSMKPINIKRLLQVRGFKLNSHIVSKVIKQMKYNNFLQTPYWKGISKYIKYKNRYKCEICSKTNCELHIHHSTYKIHGIEIRKLKTLKCLCSDCHKKFHNIKY